MSKPSNQDNLTKLLDWINRSTKKRHLVRIAITFVSGVCLLRAFGSAMPLSTLPGNARTAHAQSLSFYEGKTVRLIIGPGGGYDYWGRLVARYMAKYIPGNPAFVVQNMPGAGSVIATNYVYTSPSPTASRWGCPPNKSTWASLSAIPK